MSNNDLIENAKPILFNTEMVKAILDGRKTQTRRVIKTDGVYFQNSWETNKRQAVFMDKDRNPEYIDYPEETDFKSILYVRETFGEYYEMCNHGNFCDCEPEIIFKAGGNFPYDDKIIKRWKPSIHMPKEYARILLKVTNIRVERLQSITHQDIFKEGYREGTSISVEGWFKKLWNSTAKDNYKWEDNPYVFVYEFERVFHE